MQDVVAPVLETAKPALSNEQRRAIADLLYANTSDDTLKRHEMLGGEITREQLKGWADEQIMWGSITRACEAYAAMGLEIPKTTFIAAGDRQFERGDYRRGIALYEAAGVDVPSALLVACGDTWVQALLFSFNSHDAHHPIEAYELAGARRKLEELRDRFIAMQWPDQAEAARAAAERLGAVA